MVVMYCAPCIQFFPVLDSSNIPSIRKPLSVLASLNVLSEPKRAQNGILRLAKTAKEPKRFLMSPIAL